MKLNERGEPKTRVSADPNKPVEGKATKLMSKKARRTAKAKYATKKGKN